MSAEPGDARLRRGPVAGSPKADGGSRFGLSRPVWLLGWVSFWTDTATEMVYPLLPLFLTRVLGASAMSLGVIEGIAEAANSVLKVLSGRLSDRTGSPKPIVVAGYALSSAVRPLIALAASWPHVLLLRFSDRLGKGIRGAPRDAMLATLADPQQRGRVYGFHRAMDHAGAVLGPLLAAAFLLLYPGEYRALFALTVVPGAFVILLLLRVPAVGTPVHRPPAGAAAATRRGSAFWPGSPLARALGIILVFTLGNASDAFLLLRLSELGIAAVWIPLLWSALHVVKVVSSALGGALSDRLGRRALIGLGWIVYAVVYAGFGLVTAPAAVVAIFLVYGLYFGLTEGAEKAWIADLTEPHERGTAFGYYNAALGAGGLAASLLFGFIWTRVSPAAAFLTGAGLSLAAVVLLRVAGPPTRRASEVGPRTSGVGRRASGAGHHSANVGGRGTAET